jgi:hypothetical protein
MTTANATLEAPRRTLFQVPFLAGNGMRLFLTSGTILFVELMLIRWIPANVTYIGFFNNFLLMASFLGIGLGILLGRRGWSPAPRPSPCCCSRSVRWSSGSSSTSS